MIFAIGLTVILYSSATMLVHWGMLKFNLSYKKIKATQQWRVTFRLVRCFAGLTVSMS